MNTNSPFVQKIRPDTRECKISIYHNHHDEYVDRRTANETKEFIQANLHLGAKEIFSKLITDPSRKSSAQGTTQKQVYYWWRDMSRSDWNLAFDEIESTKLLFQRYEDVIEGFTLEIDGQVAAGVGFIVKETVEKLKECYEVGMDATCK